MVRVTVRVRARVRIRVRVRVECLEVRLQVGWVVVSIAIVSSTSRWDGL